MCPSLNSNVKAPPCKFVISLAHVCREMFADENPSSSCRNYRGKGGEGETVQPTDRPSPSPRAIAAALLGDREVGGQADRSLSKLNSTRVCIISHSLVRRPFPPSQSHTPLSYLALRCAAQISPIPPSSLLPSSDVDLGLFLWPNRDHPPSRSPNGVSALQSCRGTTRRPRTRSTRSGATGTTRGPSSSASTPSPSRSSARSSRRPYPRGRPSRRSGSTSGAGRASRTKVRLAAIFRGYFKLMILFYFTIYVASWFCYLFYARVKEEEEKYVRSFPQVLL